MTEFVGQWLTFSLDQLQHIIRMMYWVWIPGFLLSALVSLRYRTQAREAVLAHGKGGFAGLFPRAVCSGVTASPRPGSSLADMLALLQGGVRPAGALAALVASRNLPLYFLTILTLLLGIEFAVGHILGTVAMAASVFIGAAGFTKADAWTRAAGARGATVEALRPPRRDGELPSWTGLLLRGRGWVRILRYCGTEFRWFWPGLAIGILLGGLVLAAGLKRWWVELAEVGGGGIISDLVNAGVGPALGALLSLPPVGNLPAAASLFKTDTLGYPGLVSLVLASSLRPADLRAYGATWGRGAAARLALLLYAAALLGGLFATGVLALFGVRPGHIPLFRELVDEIIKRVPFAMPAGPMRL
ncbi:MAG: permease [Candidatus Methylomirabilales bacterium]